jgi:hypothetical protein
MAKRVKQNGFKMQRDRFLATLTYKAWSGIGWYPRRVITIDVRAMPTNRAELHMWIMLLVSRIWWDVSELDSLAYTARLAIGSVKRRYRGSARKGRGHWV